MWFLRVDDNHTGLRFRPNFWYDRRSMTFLMSQIPGVGMTRVRGWWTVAVVAAMATVACGTEPPTEPVPEPQVGRTPPAQDDAGRGEIIGTAPSANGTVVPIVILHPHADIDVPLPDELPVMDQYGRQFVPTFLLVRQGQTVNFTNSEDDLHTVHLKDSAGESLINVATLEGSSYKYTFDQADDYTVVCNTHTEMFADILVVDTPYAVVADSDGAFTMPEVIPGGYSVTVILGTERTEREIEVVAGRNVIDLTGP
jgi:hypothetical protein